MLFRWLAVGTAVVIFFFFIRWLHLLPLAIKKVVRLPVCQFAGLLALAWQMHRGAHKHSLYGSANRGWLDRKMKMYRLEQAPRYTKLDTTAIPISQARVLFVRRLHIFVYFSTPLLLLQWQRHRQPFVSAGREKKEVHNFRFNSELNLLGDIHKIQFTTFELINYQVK